jgi:hypothetical protein
MSDSIYYTNHIQNINKFSLDELYKRIPQSCYIKSPIKRQARQGGTRKIRRKYCN